VKFRVLVLAALAALLLGSSASAAPFNTVRIAAYYPWFPEGWTYAEMNPFTHFRPSLGFYDAGQPTVIARQIRAMKYGRITAATYSWWGQGSPTDRRFDTHLAAGSQLRFKWAIYHELEGYGDPSVDEIRNDLEYIRDRYAKSRGYLKLGSRPVVFVYGDADDGVGCDAATRWAAANATVGAFLVMRSFQGYRSCAAAVDGWHPYAAHKYEFDLFPFAYAISPGFFFAKSDRPTRRRNIASWTRSVRRMATSQAQFQFVISFNEWGEGTAIESAVQWASPSGYGRYLDVLHAIPSS
jgi:Glycosyl hydrolase family 99